MIQERSPGRFAARVTASGHQIWLGTYPSRADAENAILRAGRGEMPDHVTVGEWAERWQGIYPGSRNRDTQRHTAQMVAPFARAYARHKLRDVSPLTAQAWTVRYPGQVRYLRLMFSKAVKAGIVSRNVWDDVEAPGAGSKTTARRAPSVGELEAMVRAARRRFGDHTADMIVFTAYTGLRLSEMADAQASDMRADGRRLLVRGKRRAGEDLPRERTVAVFPAARAAWAAHAPDVGVVWRAPKGARWDRNTAGSMIRTVCRLAGVAPGITFHSLRHFHASWLLDQGASDLDVALQLGHARLNGTVDPGLVRRVYGHPDVEQGLRRLEEKAS